MVNFCHAEYSTAGVGKPQIVSCVWPIGYFNSFW